MSLGYRSATNWLGRKAEIFRFGAAPMLARAWPVQNVTAEALVGRLYLTLSAEQKRDICFDWDYGDEKRGLVRSFIANHWQVTRPCIRGGYFSPLQEKLIFRIFLSLLNPKWHGRFMRQLSDDTHGHKWGQDQSIAFFGAPGSGAYQFVFCGRHLTLRVNGDPANQAAFGGPVVYAHAAAGYAESPHHPGNIFWPQAQAASRLYDMLDADQRLLAVLPRLPAEEDIEFPEHPKGVSAACFSAAQRRQLGVLVDLLFEPYRSDDRACLLKCLNAQGGMDALYLSFSDEHRISAPDWDIWRLEGPAFVWHFQGFPHVHGWVNVAPAPGMKANSRHGAYIFPEHDELL